MKNVMKILAFLGFLFAAQTLKAQNEMDEMSLIHFDNGIGFHSPDSMFAINIRFRMQNRVGVLSESESDLSIREVEAMVKRLRLRFDGFVINSKFSYLFQVAFTRYDLDWDRSRTPNLLRDAMIYYRPGKNFYMGFGQGKLPGNRQRVISSGQQQFADRSLSNNTFHLDRDFGIFAYYTIPTSLPVFMFKGAVTTGEGRVGTKTNNGLAYTLRAEALPLGSFTNNGDYSEGDLMREEKLKLSVGGGFHYNNKALKTGGEYGDLLYESRDMKSAFSDLLMKYRGWALSGEYLLRRTPGDPVTRNAERTDSVWVYSGDGFNMQLSYVFKSNFEIAGRFSGIRPAAKISALEADTDYYTLGVSKYIRDHKVKLQANLTYRQQQAIPYIKPAKRDWLLMLQFEVGI